MMLPSSGRKQKKEGMTSLLNISLREVHCLPLLQIYTLSDCQLPESKELSYNYYFTFSLRFRYTLNYLSHLKCTYKAFL